MIGAHGLTVSQQTKYDLFVHLVCVVRLNRVICTQPECTCGKSCCNHCFVSQGILDCLPPIFRCWAFQYRVCGTGSMCKGCSHVCNCNCLTFHLLCFSKVKTSVVLAGPLLIPLHNHKTTSFVTMVQVSKALLTTSGALLNYKVKVVRLWGICPSHHHQPHVAAPHLATHTGHRIHAIPLLSFHHVWNMARCAPQSVSQDHHHRYAHTPSCRLPPAAHVLTRVHTGKDIVLYCVLPLAAVIGYANDFTEREKMRHRF